MRRYFGFIFALLLAASPAWATERTVIVVLFDGFSPAELDAAHPTPNLDRLRQEGAWSRHLVPAFPTISLINHTTFETGCWPEHHGIVSNAFIDPKIGRFGGDDVDDGDGAWRTGCETMWDAAERQGVRTAALNFIGRWSSKTGYRSAYANHEVPWKKHESDDTIVGRALALLRDNGPKHARLIALYFSIPDSVAHYNGVTGVKTQDAVKRADAIAGKLMAAIRALPPGREGTLVVGTDHGMMDVGPIVNLGRIMNDNNIHARQATDGASSFLYLDKGESADRVQKSLQQYSSIFTVYRTGHYPPFAHLGTGPRLGDLMLLTHPPYWMAGPEVFPWWAKWVGVNWLWPVTFVPPVGGIVATHGYDPGIVQMHGIFYVWGAGVRPGEVKRLDQVDVHPTVMRLLGLQPGQPVDGNAISAVLAPTEH